MSRTATMVWMSTGSAISAGDAAIRVWPTIIRVAGTTRSYARGRVLTTEVIPVGAWVAIAARNATVLSWLTIEGVAGTGGMGTRSSGNEGNDWRPCGNRVIESIITEWRFQPWAGGKSTCCKASKVDRHGVGFPACECICHVQ